MTVIAGLLIIVSGVLFLAGVVWLAIALLRKKSVRRSLGSIVLGVVVFVVGVILGVAGDNGEGSGTDGERASSDENKESDERGQKNDIAGLNEAVVSANWEVVVTGAPIKRKTLSSSFSTYEAAGVYLIVPLKVKSVGDEGSTISDWQIKLIDGLDREFDPADFSVQRAAGGGLFLEQINPGLEKSTALVFDVPIDKPSWTLEIRGALFSSRAYIDLGSF